MPDPHEVEPPDKIQELVVRYLDDLEHDRAEAPESYTRALGPNERREFDQLLETVSWTHSQLPHDPLPGQPFASKYLLVEEIGRGGFGQVWRADRVDGGGQVAIKIVDTVAPNAAHAAFAHVAEQRALGRLDVDGVVRVIESDRAEDYLFLVMELIEGRSLDRVLGDLGRLATSGVVPTPQGLIDAIPGATLGADSLLHGVRNWPDAACKITVEVLRTLALVHGRGIVHRDLKPSNVMLQPDCRPVLLDFGLASLRDRDSHFVTSRLVGSLQYLAPEQLRTGRTGDDPRTDVYQVGLLLYELLKLRPAQPEIDQIRQRRFDRGRTDPVSIPAFLEEVCLHAVSDDPDRRYQTAEAFRADLDRFLRREVPRISIDDPTTRLPDRFELRATLRESPLELRYAAFDKELGRDVELELPGPAVAALYVTSAADRERLGREAQVRSKVRNPHVQALYDRHETPAGPVLVLEPCPGEPLDHRLRKRPRLALREALAIARDVASAAGALHALGAVHRAVQESNIRIAAADGRAVLGGFVFAKARGTTSSINYDLRRSREDPVLDALPDHPAPEQLQGHPADPRSDIFALGCVLYHCATGEPAFSAQASSFDRPRAAHLVVDTIPRSVSKLLDRCLAHRPEDRFGSMPEFESAIAAELHKIDRDSSEMGGPLGWLRRILRLGGG